MLREIFIASNNKGKIAEFEQFFSAKGISVKSLQDLPEPIDVVEDGDSFEANAVKKAEEIGKAFEIAVLADDSGLEVDALDGAPGIYSARYAGEEKNDAANNEKLLRELSGHENRTARFVCALAIFDPEAGTKVVRGTVEGEIGESAQGTQGFGYDPLFYVSSEKRFMAELSREEKNKVSHRANALQKLAEDWQQ